MFKNPTIYFNALFNPLGNSTFSCPEVVLAFLLYEGSTVHNASNQFVSCVYFFFVDFKWCVRVYVCVYIYIYIYIYYMKLFTSTLIRSLSEFLPSLFFLSVETSFTQYICVHYYFVFFSLDLLSLHSFIYLLLYPLSLILFYISCLLHLYFNLPVLECSVFFKSY